MSESGTKIFFWLCLGTVLYTYLGYGVLLYTLLRLRSRAAGQARPAGPDDFEPSVAFVVCAYNEADWIAEKIQNSIGLDYPLDKVTFYFVTDGSDDATPDKVRAYPYPSGVRWQLLHQPERRGKIVAFQRAMSSIEAPIVVSTDANTLLNREALRRIVQHFRSEDVGAVAGEKRIQMDEKANASSAGEGIYWKYESLLKKWDSEYGSVVGAAGELFAFRKAAYEHVPQDTIVEDFYMTMRIAQKGYKVRYEPDAYAVERSSASVGEELKRKIRIAAGGLQAFVRLAPLLNVFRYGKLSFQYVSHRVLRWTLAPLALPFLFLLNFKLARSGDMFYEALFAGQIVFYFLALVGYFLEQYQLKLKMFFVPYYFCIMNYAMYAGFFRLVRGRQSVLWERSKRAV
jgi:poly-beta-1,6-N-acetyl-D-glucosamine synthase